jgi:predicted nucleic acid-binding protein
VIVLDASVVVEWLLDLPRADAIEQRIADPDEALHAPHLLTVEVTQVLRRFEGSGQVSSERATEALIDLGDLDVARHDHEPLLPTLWRLRSNLTAYDAAYVALALALDAPLLTLDRRIRDAPGHDARVELLV